MNPKTKQQIDFINQYVKEQLDHRIQTLSTLNSKLDQDLRSLHLSNQTTIHLLNKMAANYPHKTHSQRISFTNIDCSYDQIKSHKQDRQDATPYVKKNRQDDSQKHQTIESRKTEDSIDQKSLSNQKITKTKSDQKINSRPNLSKQNSGSKTSNPNQIKNQKQRVNRPVSSFDKKQEKTRKTPDVTIDLNQSQQNVQSQQIVDVVNVNELIRNQEMLNKTDNNIYLGDSQPQLDNQKKTSDDMNIKSNLRNDIVLDNNDKNYIDLDDSVNAIMKQFNEKRNEQQSSIDQKLNEMRSDYKRPDSSLDQYRDKVKIPNILRVEQLNTSNLEVIKEDEDNQEEPPFIQPDNNKLIYEDKKKQISTQSKNTNINNNNNRNQNQNQKLKPQQQKQQQQQQQQQQQKQQQQKQQQQRNKQNQNQNQNQKQTKKQQQQQTQSQKQVVDQNDPIQQKKQKLEEKIQNILDLQMEDIQEDPPFNFSLLPSSAIDLLEPEFVDDFVKVNMENQVNQDKVLSIVEGFFIINNEEGLIDKDRKVFWENAKKYFSQNKQNIVELVKGITNCGRFEVKKIMRLYKLYNKYPFIIMAQEYDEVDGLCGVLAFVLQDILSYYGILPKENLSQQTYEYKIYMFNKQRFMYYQQKLDAINIKLQ